MEMKYNCNIKYRNGMYWWLDKQSSAGSTKVTIEYSAESDGEALYIAALLSHCCYNSDLVYDPRLSAIQIVSFENDFTNINHEQCEILMDEPTKYINTYVNRMCRSGPYVTKVNRSDGTVLWQDKTLDPDYVWPMQYVYTVFYGSLDEIKTGKLQAKCSRSYLSPREGQAPLSATLRFLYIYNTGAKIIRPEDEPTEFKFTLGSYDPQIINAIIRNDVYDISRIGPNKLQIAFILDDNNNMIWKNECLYHDVQIPDRSKLMEPE